MLSSAHKVELWDSIGLGLLLPFGLSHGPGMLSEALGPVMAFLRVTWGIWIASYMDDILIQGFSPSQVCLHAFFPKATSHSSEIHFDLCLHDCLLSFRQDYLGQL